MERAAARSGPSSKMLEWGRSGSEDVIFFMPEILAGTGSVGKPRRFDSRFGRLMDVIRANENLEYNMKTVVFWIKLCKILLWILKSGFRFISTFGWGIYCMANRGISRRKYFWEKTI